MMVRVELSDEAWSLMVSGQLKIPGISLRSETLVVLEGAARIEWTKPTPRTIRSVVCDVSEAKDLLDWCEKSAEILAHSPEYRHRDQAQTLMSAADKIREGIRLSAAEGP